MTNSTMNEEHQDGSLCECCAKCKMCITCGDCDNLGCGNIQKINESEIQK